LIKKMKSSKLNILPSFVEVSPLVDLEALASGMNVITTKYSSTNEMFESASVKYIDPNKLESTLIKDMYNQEFDYSLQNRLLKDYSWEKTTYKLFNTYQEII